MPTERPTPAHIEIDLPVYTGIFHLQRRLYRVYDVELPMPVSFPQAVAFLAVGSLMFIGLRAAGIELSPGTAWAFLVPPGMAAWLANRPVADQRSPLQWAAAQARYLLEPRAITGLKPERVPRSQRLSVTVWEPRQPQPRRRRPEKRTRGNNGPVETPIASNLVEPTAAEAPASDSLAKQPRRRRAEKRTRGNDLAPDQGIASSLVETPVPETPTAEPGSVEPVDPEAPTPATPAKPAKEATQRQRRRAEKRTRGNNLASDQGIASSLVDTPVPEMPAAEPSSVEPDLPEAPAPAPASASAPDVPAQPRRRLLRGSRTDKRSEAPPPEPAIADAEIELIVFDPAPDPVASPPAPIVSAPPPAESLSLVEPEPIEPPVLDTEVPPVEAFVVASPAAESPPAPAPAPAPARRRRGAHHARRSRRNRSKDTP